jgi:hypothetical protein
LYLLHATYLINLEGRPRIFGVLAKKAHKHPLIYITSLPCKMASLNTKCPAFDESAEWKQLQHDYQNRRNIMIYLMVVIAIFWISHMVDQSYQKRLRKQIESLEAKVATISQNSYQQMSAGAPVSFTPMTMLSPTDIGVAVPLGSPLCVGIPLAPFQRARIADSGPLYSYV